LHCPPWSSDLLLVSDQRIPSIFCLCPSPSDIFEDFCALCLDVLAPTQFGYPAVFFLRFRTAVWQSSLVVTAVYIYFSGGTHRMCLAQLSNFLPSLPPTSWSPSSSKCLHYQPPCLSQCKGVNPFSAPLIIPSIFTTKPKYTSLHCLAYPSFQATIFEL